MITLRPSAARGHADHGWLKSYHTFSFADYHDLEHMGFRSLRVINEDWVAPGMGFGTHPHENMEILTYVVEGALAHRDSMGNGQAINPGEVQAMSAGTGVTHSEYNHSKKEPVHLLQIWIKPERRGLAPSYAQRKFSNEEKAGKLRQIAGGQPQDGALKINQDANIFASLLKPGEKLSHDLKPGRHAWLQLISGAITLNGKALAKGDGAAASNETKLEISATEPSEFILFDLA